MDFKRIAPKPSFTFHVHELLEVLGWLHSFCKLLFDDANNAAWHTHTHTHDTQVVKFSFLRFPRKTESALLPAPTGVKWTAACEASCPGKRGHSNHVVLGSSLGVRSPASAVSGSHRSVAPAVSTPAAEGPPRRKMKWCPLSPFLSFPDATLSQAPERARSAMGP